jgi:hypothetical protein
VVFGNEELGVAGQERENVGAHTLYTVMPDTQGWQSRPE